MRLPDNTLRLLFRSFWIASLLGALVCTATAQQPSETSLRIRDIRVEGNQTASVSAIISFSGLHIGDQLTSGSETVARAIKNLMDRRLFSDVKIYFESQTSEGAVIVIAVTEHPRVGTISFVNNDEFSESDLKEVITLRDGDIAVPYEIDHSRAKIRAKYADEGYLFTNVTVTQGPSADSGRVDLVFNIDEGAEVSIGDIAILGNKKLSDGELKGAMEDVREKSWWQFWRSSKFDRKKLQKDKERIADYYRSKGFITADVVDDSIAIDSTSGRASIFITVSEGDQVFLRSISVTGNTVYPTPVIEKRLDVVVGEPYNQFRLEHNLQGNEENTDLRSLYFDNGYLRFDAQVAEQRSGDSVDVVIKITEGNPSTVRYVTIAGNTKTKDKVIRRELFTHPGDIFSKAALIRSLRSIANLNYFNPEHLQPDVQPVDATSVDITYKVEERPSDTFNASIGLSSQGLTGMLGLSFNNFSVTEPLLGGGGQILNFNWEFGSYLSTFSLGLTEPWLFDRPITLGASVFYQTQDLSGVSSASDNTLKRVGASLTTGWRPRWPDDFFRVDMAMRFQRNDVTGNVTYYQNGTEVSATPTISRTSIDNPVFPTVGSKFVLSSTFAGLGDAEYIKPELKLEFYSPLAQLSESNTLVFYLGSEFGYLYNYGKFENVPPLAFYSMGGTALTALNAVPLRGYEDRSIGPVSTGNIPVGQVYNKLSTELRFSISMNPIPIFVLGFAEAGNVWGSLKEVDPFNLKRSAGLGLRVMVPPVGILGFDYGYGFDPNSFSESAGGTAQRSGWQFHFQFGR